MRPHLNVFGGRNPAFAALWPGPISPTFPPHPADIQAALKKRGISQVAIVLRSLHPMKTPEQIRAEFREHGICIAQWARERGFHRLVVFDLLRGKRKGIRGEAHHAAVALGLKAAPKGRKAA